MHRMSALSEAFERFLADTGSDYVNVLHINSADSRREAGCGNEN